MEDDNRSIDSPAQSNLETSYLSNPGTPRNERNNDEIGCISSSYPIQSSNISTNVGNVNLTTNIGSATIRQQQQKPKYTQLLAIIEELGKDIRPTYAGSRSSAERLKRGIVHARILVRECLMETERNARS